MSNKKVRRCNRELNDEYVQTTISELSYQSIDTPELFDLMHCAIMSILWLQAQLEHTRELLDVALEPPTM